jgi:aspartyl-tRNA(Asn)/glutamyl-tRNA(Gln) amidotransferase subunit A
MDIKTLTIAQAKKDLKEKKYSSVELTKSYLERIKQVDSKLNAFITVTKEDALKMAEEADTKIAKGIDLPLLGIPVAMKDMYLTKGIRTTAGSKVLENFIPVYDATAVKKLKDAGVVILGKLNCDAWAHGSSGENSDFGPTKNPFDTKYVSGGSSSGSATSVAADMCLFSTGTDTGGSIRLPASFCNVVGLKPTYGRVSRYGVVAMASSLDAIGHFTKTVEDNALVLNITAGNDKKDATTPDVEVKDHTKNLKLGVKGLKIGVPKEYFIDGLDPNVKKSTEEALNILEKQGAKLVEVSLPHTKYAIAVYYIIMPSEVSSNLARYDGIRYGNDRSTFGDEAKLRIMLGTFALSAGYYDAYYNKAMQVRTLLRQDFEKAFEKVDVMITPVSPTPPFKLGERTNDPLAMYLSDIFTVTLNLTGNPGLSIPTGFIDGLPTGMQIIGPHFSEDLLYRVGYAYEKENPLYLKKPKI